MKNSIKYLGLQLQKTLISIYICITIFFALLNPNICFSQINTDKLKPWKLKNYGNRAIRSGDVYVAIDYFEKYCILKPKKYKEALILAGLYEKSRNYLKAKDCYLKIYQSDSINNIQALFKYALMQKMNCQYDSAKVGFNRFKEIYKGLKNDKELNLQLMNEIEGCNLAEKEPDPNKIKIVHLDTSINKAHVEFAPLSLDENTFLYASLRSDSLKFTVDEKGYVQMPVREFYKAIRKKDNWIGGYDSPFPVNIAGVDVGNGVLSRDGLRFYFTRCEEKVGEKIACGIYLSIYYNKKWETPLKLGNEINLKGITSTQPAIGSNSKTGNEVLYFVSDRSGGKGGMDIWYSEYDYKKDEYKIPKNCGGIINTAADELTPFFDFETRSMYFSSAGFPGLGGLDIFRVTGEMKTWTTPENLGTPVNSCTDDIYYSIAQNRDEGFFVSNRKGGLALKSETCCDDIYYYTWLNKIKLFTKGNLQAVDSNIVYGILNEKNNSDSLSRIPIRRNKMQNVPISLYLYDKTLDQRFLISKDTTDINGDFLFKIEPDKNYVVVVDTAGFFSKNIPVSTFHVTRSDTLVLKTIEMMDIPKEPIVVKNIYYPFDKSFLTEEAMIRIDTTLFRILKKLPQIIVEISSHTDSKGNDNYNLKLSQSRAESAVKYLISKGIAKERLIAKGYGESKPLVSNTNSDGSDNPDNRAKNRRTEFRIVGSLKEVYSKVIYNE